MSPRRSCSTPLLILLALLILGGAAFIGWFGYYIPHQATQLFGPPSGTLSFSQRLMYSYQLVNNRSRLLASADPNGKPILVKIELGESVDMIAHDLSGSGIISDAESFRIYLIYSGLDTKVQAGTYELDPAMSSVEIATRLLDATPSEVKFGILDGWRIEEIAASLSTSGLSISSDGFLAQARNLNIAPAIKSEIPSDKSLEGFLLPGEYQFKRNISTGEMLIAMVDRFNQEVTPEMRNNYSAEGLSLYQAVTLASIVQREAVIKEEQPMIASVFLNRIAAGMKLDSDATVQYAVGWNEAQKTWWTNPLSADDLQNDSPYNTYVYPGFPPGPIDNPGISALQAVASPEKTNYYYFRAACDGSGKHIFSETYEQHVANACP